MPEPEHRVRGLAPSVWREAWLSGGERERERDRGGGRSQ